jgi:hypothetical protein
MVNDGVVVRHGVADRAHENEFFRYFAKSIKTYFDKKKIPALLIGMPECKVDSRLQIDAILLTENTVTIIDFKDYGGTLILPDEASFKRGRWETAEGLIVKGGCSPNPFYQTGLQRERLAKILDTLCRNLSSFNPRHISTLVCFQKRMRVEGYIPGNFRSYFHIADEATFLEKMFDTVCVGREKAGLLEEKFLRVFNEKIFESSEYELEVNPAHFETIRAEGAAETDCVSEHRVPAILKDIRSFLEGDSPVLIATGTLGSGKTQLGSIIREEAFANGFTSAPVFALSNRVKRNLAGNIDEVESLYSTLFDFSSTKVDENGDRYIPLASMEDYVPFADCTAREDEMTPRQVFIVYESQLITDSARSGEMVQFGTGHLLSDLLAYLGIDKDGSKNKVVFIGDKFQLGFGSWNESCLNANWYKKEISVASIELPDAQNPNGIQETCLQIANAIRQNRTTNLVLDANDQVKICDISQERGLLEKAANDHTRHKVLSYTNRQACGLNDYVKAKIMGNGSFPASDDVVIFEDQVYAYPSKRTLNSHTAIAQFDGRVPKRIENGEIGTIVYVDTNRENWLFLEEQVSKEEAPVRLTLVDADVRLGSSEDMPTYRIRFILELLQSDSSKLDPMQEMALKVHLSSLLESYMKSHPFEKSKHFKEMISLGDFIKNASGQYRDKNDARFLTVYEKRHRSEIQQEAMRNGSEYSMWLNAARIKYGWCMTVNKAMSSEYDEVTFSTKYDGGRKNESYFRFLYTGISRARNCVNLVRWEPVSPFEKTEFGYIAEVTCRSAKKRPVLVSTVKNVSADVRGLVERSLAPGMSVKNLKSVRYQEIFEISGDESSFKAIFDYGNDGKVKAPRYATGDKELFGVFRDTVCGSTNWSSTGTEGAMCWLYDIVSMDILKEWEVKVLSSSNYRDVLELKKKNSSVDVRVDYKKDGSVSGFKALSGDRLLYNEAAQLICSYYALENPNLNQ